MQSTGTCKWFSRKLGYGFITPDSGGDDVFVHQSEIQMDEFRYLQKAEFVVWIVAKDDKGRSIAKRPRGHEALFVLMRLDLPKVHGIGLQ